MSRILQELEAVGLAYHALEKPAKQVTFVSLDFDVSSMSLRNTTKRAWRRYLASHALLKAKGATSWAIKVFLGHSAQYFSLDK